MKMERCGQIYDMFWRICQWSLCFRKYLEKETVVGIFITMVHRVTHKLGYLYNLLGIFLLWEIYLLYLIYLFIYLFIYLIRQSSISIYNHGYLFSILGYTLILHYSSFGPWELIQLALMSIQYTHIICLFVCLFFSTS